MFSVFFINIWQKIHNNYIEIIILVPSTFFCLPLIVKRYTVDQVAKSCALETWPKISVVALEIVMIFLCRNGSLHSIIKNTLSHWQFCRVLYYSRNSLVNLKTRRLLLAENTQNKIFKHHPKTGQGSKLKKKPESRLKKI